MPTAPHSRGSAAGAAAVDVSRRGWGCSPRSRALDSCGLALPSATLRRVIESPRLAKLGRALRWLRRRREMSQLELAEAAGTTRGKVSDYERGLQVPSLVVLDRMLLALGFDFGHLQQALDRFLRASEPEVFEDEEEDGADAP